jgi:hypothetical protein
MMVVFSGYIMKSEYNVKNRGEAKDHDLVVKHLKNAKKRYLNLTFIGI